MGSTLLVLLSCSLLLLIKLTENSRITIEKHAENVIGLLLLITVLLLLRSGIVHVDTSLIINGSLLRIRQTCECLVKFLLCLIRLGRFIPIRMDCEGGFMEGFLYFLWGCSLSRTQYLIVVLLTHYQPALVDIFLGVVRGFLGLRLILWLLLWWS